MTGSRYAMSEMLFDRAIRSIAGGVDSNFRLYGDPVPLFFKRGEGSLLVDVDGNVYVDYTQGMGPNVLGHTPRDVAQSVVEGLELGQLYAGQHRAEIELAERVCRLLPSAELVRFGSSGSEMVHAALRVARAATGRRLIIKFEGHYHGWLDGIFVSTAPPPDLVGPYDHPDPHLASAGQSIAAANDFVVLPWNNPDLLEAFLARHSSTIAAIIMEPILCNTSVILPRTGYLEAVRQLCDSHGLVLIFDEVITAFRVGLSGAQGRLGVVPDLTIVAKALGGGFPIAALVGKARYMRLIGDGSVMHGGTYNGNLVSIRAALATLDAIERDQGATLARMEQLGLQLMAGLSELAVSSELPLRVQGLGAVFNTSFWNGPPPHDYRSYRQADGVLQLRFVRALQDAGVRITNRGTWFMSTAHSEDDIQATLAATSMALRSLANTGNVP